MRRHGNIVTRKDMEIMSHEKSWKILHHMKRHKDMEDTLSHENTKVLSHKKTWKYCYSKRHEKIHLSKLC